MSTPKTGTKRPHTDDNIRSPSSDRPAPKRVACIHCRQSKLRCNSYERDPCSRCERLGLHCTKDTGFKRVNRKSKVDELEQEIHQLKAALVPNGTAQPLADVGTPAASPSTQAAAASLASFPNSGFAFQAAGKYFPPLEAMYPTAPNVSAPETPRQLSAPSLSRPSQSSSSKISMPPATKLRAIESTALSAEQITELFQRYFQNNHPFLPMLDSSKSPDDYYESSHLLFWAVVVVATRNWPTDRTLCVSLYKAVQKMAWERVADPPLSVQNIQALLLMCMWPSTTMYLWSDISMSFSNIATTTAMHTGLHRPDHIQEFMRRPRVPYVLPLTEDERTSRGKTWAACNIVGQYMTSSFGLPPMISYFDWAINRACELGNRHTLPDDLRHHLILQRFSHRTTALISSNRADSLGLPGDSEFGIFMDMLEADLGIIEADISPSINTINGLLLHAVRFTLQSLHWLRPNMNHSKRAGVLRSYATACSYVSAFLSIDEVAPILSSAPIFCGQHFLSAGYIIYKILNSSLRVLVDQTEGAAMIASCQKALRRMSAAESDLAVRAANILQDIWAHREDDPTEKDREPSLAIRSRMACSLTSDAAWRWRTYFAKSKEEFARRPGERDGNVGTANGQVDEQADFAFNWDLFEDMDWSWAFDLPIGEEPILPVGQ